MLYLFSCTYFHFYIFSDEMSIQVFWPFLNWTVFLLLSCKNSSYVLKDTLYQLYILHIFSPSLWFVFIFLTLTLKDQKLSILMNPITNFYINFFIFEIRVFKICWLQLITCVYLFHWIYDASNFLSLYRGDMSINIFLSEYFPLLPWLTNTPVTNTMFIKINMQVSVLQPWSIFLFPLTPKE